ncbi:MAG TPA: thiol:disulfide interchange protein DsbA/DsbL [Rhodocyclaceae bacterium]|nr:thiol:disulfide interchange protein DsbA/DsbL [Rhodocyclaceae bacterium]
MLKKLLMLAGLLLALVAGGAHAQLQAGRDYDLINPPQPTNARGKVEVIEFFSYMCPHCDAFDPILDKWLKTLPKDVVFRRVPVIFRPQWEATARLYYTLEAMGELNRLHSAVFTAIHRQYQDLTTEAGVTAWAVKSGLDRKKFVATYESFAVQSRTQGAKQMQGAYGIPGVPAMVVAGKYRTPDEFPGGFDGLLKLVDKLIVKARAEQGRK